MIIVNTKYTFENENINSLNFTLYIEKVYITKMPYRGSSLLVLNKIRLVLN